jgi:hypothetical protein
MKPSRLSGRAASFRLPALALLVAATVAAAAPAPPGAQWLVEQVRVLSAPEMDGRAAGTPGATRAADHVDRAFAQAGLRPGGDAGTFRQAFTVPTGIAPGPRNTMAVLVPGAAPLARGRDFTPLASSADGATTAEVVFVGYGITAPALGWDDYAGVDARGKLVLVMTGDPGGGDPASAFRRPEAYHFRERAHKVINAREHGAAGILLVTHPSESGETLPALRGISQPLGILAAFVTRGTADAALRAAGADLGALAAAVEGARQPRSRALAGVRAQIEVSLVRQRGTALNVIGLLPGTDGRLKDEAIVVGAHYDHLGHGGEGSLAPEQLGTIHRGADDNASGTAAVMGLARAFAAAGGAPRTLVFVAFAGEEMGLLGSAHYVRHPAFPLDRTVLMLNLDMVGRLRDGKLYVGGVDSGTGLRAVVARAARGLPLSPELRGDPFAPSDHTSFYTAARPVLFLFTGAHADYHRPSDTWEKVNGPGLAAVTELAARIVAAVAQDPQPPAYVKSQAPAASTRGGYGPYFGVVPEFGEAERPGVRIGGVRPGSPAEKAGVQSGDVLVRFAGVDVKSLQDFTFALRGKRPGDRVEVVIVRDGQERRLEALLEERRQ